MRRKCCCPAVAVLTVADHQFDAHRRRARLQQVDGLRKALVGNKEFVRTAFDGLARTVVEQHRHRFRGRGGLVQQRRIRDFHPGQVHDHGLEIQQGFQATLRDLGLIGRVGGVPARIFQDVALYHRRHDGVVIAQPDIGAEYLVLCGDAAQMLVVLIFGHASRQIQRLLQADCGRNGLRDQFIDRACADFFQHRGYIVGARAVMTVYKLVGHRESFLEKKLEREGRRNAPSVLKGEECRAIRAQVLPFPLHTYPFPGF